MPERIECREHPVAYGGGGGELIMLERMSHRERPVGRRGVWED